MTLPNFKVFKLEKREDYIIYLRFLIVTGHKLLLQYRTYLKELELKIEELNLKDEDVLFFNGRIYDDFRDKISFVSISLLNLLADETKSAASYRKFRKLIERRKDEGLFGVKELPDDINSIIFQFNINRNWSAHIPESIIHAQFEAIEKFNGFDSKGELINKPNPIVVYIYDKYDSRWLVSLFEESSHMYEGFRKVLQQMKKDYSKLIGESIQIITEKPEEARSYEIDISIPITSMEMQNKKYKRDNE